MRIHTVAVLAAALVGAAPAVGPRAADAQPTVPAGHQYVVAVSGMH